MIQYDNGDIYSILFTRTGSVLPACLPVGLMSFCIGLTLALIRQYDLENSFFTTSKELYIRDPFAIQIIAVVVGYLLVVRTNMALSRWMEGISDVQLMLSKFSDAFNALNAFFCGKDGDPDDMLEILYFRVRIAHWFSLMSCLVFATLRNHGELGPLEEVPIKELFASPEEMATQRATSFAANKLSEKRSRRHTKRKAGGRLSQLDPESEFSRQSDRASRMSTFENNRDSRMSIGSAASQMSVLSSMTEEHGSNDYAGSRKATDAAQGTKSPTASHKQDKSQPKLQEDLDLLVLSLPSAEEVSLLAMANDKPNTICLWIIQDIISMIRKGLLDVPAPIVSRVFQEISNGMLGYNQAHKVAMVPFPFPFAQMVSLMLMTLYIGLPFYIDLFTQHPVITPLISFLLPMVYCALNTISVELEEPFGTDDNDVDIEIRHEDFLWLLVDVLRAPKGCPNSGDTSFDLEESIVRGLVRGCPVIPAESTAFLARRDAEEKERKQARLMAIANMTLDAEEEAGTSTGGQGRSSVYSQSGKEEVAPAVSSSRHSTVDSSAPRVLPDQI